jgi:hypothetical protein
LAVSLLLEICKPYIILLMVASALHQNLGEGQEPAIKFPGSPKFRNGACDPLVLPKPVWTSNDVLDDESELSDAQ